MRLVAGRDRIGHPSSGPYRTQKWRAVPKRVLVIEDEPDIARLIALILEAAAYKVVEAESLAAARARLTEGRLDAVLLDLVLPDGDALAFCQELKARAPGAPVLMLTADVAPEVRSRALAAGCAHFLPKPFEPETLEAVVRLVLGDGPDRRVRAGPAAARGPRRRYDDPEGAAPPVA
jgi:DNA-binding response OmpR family regulator